MIKKALPPIFTPFRLIRAPSGRDTSLRGRGRLRRESGERAMAGIARLADGGWDG